MNTKILIKTPYFGDRPYDIESLQRLLPFTILSITQGSFELTIEIMEEVTQQQVDDTVEDIRNYILSNLITATIIH